MNTEEIKKLYYALKQIDFFTDISVHEMDLLIDTLKTESAEAGRVIVKQGKKGDCLYLVSKGKLSAWIKTGFFGKKKTGELKEGQYFGEMALLNDQRRKATVVADTACELLVLYRRDFWEIIMKNPSIEEKINTIAKQRAEQNEKKK
jgi:CRP-like cAMP-binding protein